MAELRTSLLSVLSRCRPHPCAPFWGNHAGSVACRPLPTGGLGGDEGCAVLGTIGILALHEIVCLSMLSLLPPPCHSYLAGPNAVAWRVSTLAWRPAPPDTFGDSFLMMEWSHYSLWTYLNTREVAKNSTNKHRHHVREFAKNFITNTVFSTEYTIYDPNEAFFQSSFKCKMTPFFKTR